MSHVLMNPADPMATIITTVDNGLRLNQPKPHLTLEKSRFAANETNVSTNGIDIKCGCKSPSIRLKKGNS